VLLNPRKLRLVAGFAAVAIPGFAQVSMELANSARTKISLKPNRAVGLGPRLVSHSNSTGTGPGLAFFTADFLSLGSKELPINIVGTNPSLGANTTVVPTVLVPLKFIFPNPGHPVLDGTNVIEATANSPIFQVADYTTGGVDLGVTQFGDALQRGEFWNLPGFSTNYHVLLGTPAVAPTVTVTVPAGLGNAFPLLHGSFFGVLDPTFFNGVLATLLSSYTANELPIFMTDNVVLGVQGQLQNCCAIGFHSSTGGGPIATAQTWIYASFIQPGTIVGDPILDVQSLSHEVAEWLNDPFVGGPVIGGVNLVAPFVVPGTGGLCQINFETGDVLEAPPVVFTQVTNGTTYHLQDEAFLPYFLHSAPSFSVAGFYSLIGTFQTFSTLCGPG